MVSYYIQLIVINVILCLISSVGTDRSFTIDNKQLPLSIYIDASPANQITGLLTGIIFEEGLGFRNVAYVNDSLPGLLTVSRVNAYISKTCALSR